MYNVHPALIRFEYRSFDSICHEATAVSDGLETGGILLGHERADCGEIVVTVGGGPGPGAVRSPSFFKRDLAYAIQLGDEAYERDGSVWVGEWHTHPGQLRRPSRRDLRTYRRFLEDSELDFRSFTSVIVTGTPTWDETSCAAWSVALPPPNMADRLRVRPLEIEVSLPEAEPL